MSRSTIIYISIAWWSYARRNEETRGYTWVRPTSPYQVIPDGDKGGRVYPIECLNSKLWVLMGNIPKKTKKPGRR